MEEKQFAGSNALLRDGAKAIIDLSDVFGEYINRFPDKINIEKPELIKQVEQVDVATLEQCVLDGVIDLNDLQDCQTVTNVVTLRMSKVREKQANEL